MENISVGWQPVVVWRSLLGILSEYCNELKLSWWVLWLYSFAKLACQSCWVSLVWSSKEIFFEYLLLCLKKNGHGSRLLQLIYAWVGRVQITVYEVELLLMYSCTALFVIKTWFWAVDSCLNVPLEQSFLLTKLTSKLRASSHWTLRI